MQTFSGRLAVFDYIQSSLIDQSHRECKKLCFFKIRCQDVLRCQLHGCSRVRSVKVLKRSLNTTTVYVIEQNAFLRTALVVSLASAPESSLCYRRARNSIRLLQTIGAMESSSCGNAASTRRVDNTSRSRFFIDA